MKACLIVCLCLAALLSARAEKAHPEMLILTNVNVVNTRDAPAFCFPTDETV